MTTLAFRNLGCSKNVIDGETIIAWLESHSISPDAIKGRIQLPGNFMLDGARDGQGVIVTVQKFVQNDLDAGRLRVLFQGRSGGGYHIVTRPGVLRPGKS